jgi:hypothetical protein
MNSKGSQDSAEGAPRSQAAANREARLKQALKANLGRRKEQARARGKHDKTATDKPDEEKG